jgi:penicillin-binding protein 1A
LAEALLRKKESVAQRRAKSRHSKSGGLIAFIGRMLRAAFVLACVAAAVAVGYAGAYIWKQLRELPDVAVLERYEPIEAIQIFDRNDRLVCTVEGDEDRRVVPLTQVANQMQQAILAAEDHHFYEHHGINLPSIVRAALANLQAGRVVEGGSTITQQLVKNLFFDEPRRTLDRKVKEAFMAWELERRYPKDKILELYLNQVYFGNGGYGIERAAARYFDKTAGSLSLAESAYLAGLVKAPSELSADRQVALARQRDILNKMVEYGYITRDQADSAKKQRLEFKRGVNPLQKYPYYISYVQQVLQSRFSQAEMRRQGLRVYTNLDPVAQETGERTLTEAIKKAPKGVSQGALVSVQVSDGAVIALVGGVGDFWKAQWNRATNPHTAGSSFKPFVYLAAFMKGVLRPDSVIEDTPLVVKQSWGLPPYAPKNFDKKFMGRITVRKALALSRNVCAVRAAQLVGMDRIIETARLAGITAKLDPNLSLALGSSAVSPLDMAGAYATFARAGVAIKPQVIRRIENNKGQVIEVFESRVDKVFEPEPVAELVDVLQDVVKFGTGTQARLPDRPVAGKTGTADESKDIWFIGFTPDLVTAVWGGNDENLPIPGTYVTGGTVMARIWRQYNQAYYEKHPTPPGSFIAPMKLVEEEPAEGAEPAGIEAERTLPPPDSVPVAPPGMEPGDTPVSAPAETGAADLEAPVEPAPAHGGQPMLPGGPVPAPLPEIPRPVPPVQAPSAYPNSFPSPRAPYPGPTIMMQFPGNSAPGHADGRARDGAAATPALPGGAPDSTILQSHKGVTNYR